MKFAVFASFRWFACLTAAAGLLMLAAATADDAGPRGTPPAATTPPLATSQEAITMRYRRFEETLHQLADYLRKSDPQRAELLVRAVGKSKEGRVHELLKDLTDVLKKDQLGDAIEREEQVIVQMQTVLELLMSEARQDEIEKERARIKDLIKDVDKLIARQTDARVSTERGGNPEDLQKQQKQVADGAQKLVQKIDRQDAVKKAEKQKSSGSEAEDKPKSDEKDGAPDKDSKPKDSENNSDSNGDKPADDADKSGSSKEGDPKEASKPQDKGEDQDKDKQSGKDSKSDKHDPKSDQSKDAKDQPKDGDPKQAQPGESKDNPDSKPQSGKPKKGKPQKGQPQDKSQEKPQDKPPSDQPEDEQEQDESPPKQEKTPGRDDVEKAQKEMDRAIEELKKKRNTKASDRQDQALADLMKAREKLEEILRQLREEERAMVLATLEARFRDMLQQQETVNIGTLGIHAIPADKRTDRHRNRSVELARNEDAIALLAAKALTLLKEEGSSVAFPEAVEQIRDDMLTIARRLERADVGEITQNIEQDVIESLKEILEALQKELEKLKDEQQKKQQQKQQQQEQPPPPLVNKLAELKMLRSLQYRVNRRTKQMGRLVDGEQALDVDVVSQLRQLSDRQAKVQKATHDLATGKNE